MDHLTETTLPPDPEGPGPAIQTLDLTGKTLGDFQILRRLGEGGMGQVYLAEQISLKRKVALKLLKADLASNPTALQRFKSEAEAVARKESLSTGLRRRRIPWGRILPHGDESAIKSHKWQELQSAVRRVHAKENDPVCGQFQTYHQLAEVFVFG